MWTQVRFLNPQLESLLIIMPVLPAALCQHSTHVSPVMAHSTSSPWPSLYPNIDESPGWQRRARIQTQVRFSSWAAHYNTASEIPAHPSRNTEISLKATSWPEPSWFWHSNNYLLIMEGTLDQKSGNLCPLKFLNPSHHFLFFWSWRGYNNYLSYLSHEDEVIEETDQNPSNMMKL